MLLFFITKGYCAPLRLLISLTPVLNDVICRNNEYQDNCGTVFLFLRFLCYSMYLTYCCFQTYHNKVHFHNVNLDEVTHVAIYLIVKIGPQLRSQLSIGLSQRIHSITFFTKMKFKAAGFTIFPFNVKGEDSARQWKWFWQIFSASSELSE